MDPLVTASIIGAGGSLLGGLFGGGGSSGSTSIKPWSGAQPFIKDIMGQGQDLYNMGSMNPLQMIGIMNQLGFSEQMAPGMINAAMGGWGQMLDPWSQGPMASAINAATEMSRGGINPYGQQLMDDASRRMTQSFQEGVLPQIAGNAVNTGGFGGSRQAINESLATQRFGQELGTSQNQLAAELYRQGLGQQQAGVTALGNLAGTGFNTLGSAVSGIGQMLNAGMWPGSQQYNLGSIYQNAPWQNLFNYNSVVSPYGSVGSVTSQPGMGQQIAGQVAGAALPMIVGNMFSPNNRPTTGFNPNLTPNSGEFIVNMPLG